MAVSWFETVFCVRVSLHPQRVRLALLSAILYFVFGASNAMSDAEPFIIETPSEPKTIGEIKPAFLVYKDKELPKVSVEYVLKRYIKLFENAQAPDVRVDALNRINNLSAQYGLSSKKLSIDKVRQSEAVLESYDNIVDSGIFYQRMDELLYQTAKATSFIGNAEESIKRLKLLVGLYPRSRLVDESRFRMAEAYFDLGQYAEAEAEYKKILAFSEGEDFDTKATFKAGWAVFRQNRFEEAQNLGIKTLDYFPVLKGSKEIEGLGENETDLVEDTIRLLAIMFARQDGAKTIETLQSSVGHQDYAYLLYDGLFRFHLRQDRFEEGALVAEAYTRNYPERFEAYQMALNTIRSYNKGEFDIKEWNAKENFVAQFGTETHYWTLLDEKQQSVVRPHVISYLSELAHLYYVRMQRALESEGEGHVSHALRASEYYLELAATEPESRANGEYVFLAAEANSLAGRIENAVSLYERAAYQEAPHQYASESGYAAIIKYQEWLNSLDPVSEEATTEAIVGKRRESIERFASVFPENNRTPALLNDLANELFVAGDYAYAQSTAQRVLEYDAVEEDVRYASALVNAHSLFELEEYRQAEQAYELALGFQGRKGQNALRERLAASIYKQAELTVDPLQSASLFLRVADAVPGSSIVAQSLYDASVKQLSAQSWDAAIATLNHFQHAYPDNEYYQDANEKLIYAYEQNGDQIAAAEKLVEVSNSSKDVNRAQNALFQAAEYYQQNGFGYEATQLFERFVGQYPQAFALNLEAYDRIVRFYDGEDRKQSANDWRKRLIAYEANNSGSQTSRSRYLAASAVASLAEVDRDAFYAAALTLPLKASLGEKKNALNAAVKQYEKLAGYGVAEFTSAATFEIGSLYRQLAVDLMQSERPDSLDELQLEQYDILLEEQAYPFEEKAMEIYRINIAKVASGQYDQWIAKTYTVLEQMNPTEFKRRFKSINYAESIY